MPSRSRQPRAPMTPRPDSSIAAARIAAAGHRCIPRMGSGETWQKRAFWTLSRLEVRLCWQDATAIRPQAARHGNKYPQCVLGRLAMAIYRRYAFPNVQQWQLFRFMHPKSAFGRKKRPSLATYRRRASKTSWLWQDMRAMYPKSPANRLSGMRRAQILPGRGPFRRTGPSNHARRANLAIPGCFVWVLRARWGSGAKRRHQRQDCVVCRRKHGAVMVFR